VKAVGSMVAPYLATFFAVRYSNWKILFLVFGIISIISVLWLWSIKIDETKSTNKKASFSSCLKLLKVKNVAIMVVAIFLLVGIDVGINSSSGQFLIEKLSMDSEPAKQGRSLYFFGKMLGTFVGAILLTKISSRKFFLGSALATLATILIFIWSPSPLTALILLFMMGLASSNLFPLIYSLTVKKYSNRANEISGLMIMAVSGGAFIPPLVGKISDSINITTAMYVFVFCALYLLFVSVYSFKKL
jgi:fucose permease